MNLFFCNVSYFSFAQFTNPGFVVSIHQRNKILVFEPPFNSYQNTLLNIYDMMIAAVRNLPHIETNLFLDWQGPQTFLKVCLLCCYGYSP